MMKCNYVFAIGNVVRFCFDKDNFYLDAAWDPDSVVLTSKAYSNLSEKLENKLMPAVVVTKHLDIHDYLDAVGMAEATRFYLGMTEEEIKNRVKASYGVVLYHDR